MADPSTQPMSPDDEEHVIIDSRTLAALAPETLDKLRSEFGASVQLRASKQGMAALLDSLTGKPTVSAGMRAAYDRGFDRTSPGYDKYYDRDRAALTAADPVSNPPVLDVSVLNRLVNK